MSNVLTQIIDELSRGTLQVVDLTQPLGPTTPVIGLPPMFASSPGLTLETLSKYDEKGPAWYWNVLRCGEHTGTHFDAPIHWVTGRDLSRNACDTIPPRLFVGPACVIDVTKEVSEDQDFLLTRSHLSVWERDHGRIPASAWVLLRSGWSRRAGDPVAFLNVAADGPHSPGFDPDVAKMLAYERDVIGVGVETVGTDAGQAARFDPPFPTHATMHGAGKFGLASLCNLDRLPPTGSLVIAAPLKLVGGSGSPVRAIAIAPV